MKHLMWLAFACLCLAAADSLASAQQKPDFSGTWVVVRPSQFAGQEETIVHDETSLTLVHDAEGEPHRNIYELDGKPRRDVMKSHGEDIVTVATASWEGDRIVVLRVSTYPDGRKIDSRLTFALNAEGELVRELTDVIDGKPQPTLTVFARKK